jgi:hypothetical protein
VFRLEVSQMIRGSAFQIRLYNEPYQRIAESLYPNDFAFSLSFFLLYATNCANGVSWARQINQTLPTADSQLKLFQIRNCTSAAEPLCQVFNRKTVAGIA